MSTITKITANLLEPWAELFVAVFNQPPWNDRWTLDTARARLSHIYQTPHFRGFVYEDEGQLLGMVMGYGEMWYSGMHFKVVEFCVAGEQQRKGIGSRLLQELEAALRQQQVSQIYLLTGQGGSAEAFYRQHGYMVQGGMIVMTKLLGT